MLVRDNIISYADAEDTREVAEVMPSETPRPPLCESVSAESPNVILNESTTRAVAKSTLTKAGIFIE
jgi:hypothetical protein